MHRHPPQASAPIPCRLPACLQGTHPRRAGCTTGPPSRLAGTVSASWRATSATSLCMGEPPCWGSNGTTTAAAAAAWTKRQLSVSTVRHQQLSTVQCPVLLLPKHGPGGLEGRQPPHPRHNRAGSPWLGSPGGGAAPACCAGSGPRAALRREGTGQDTGQAGGSGLQLGWPSLDAAPFLPSGSCPPRRLG